MNLNGINLLSSTSISASTDYVNIFDVDCDGNVIYSGYLISDYTTSLMRLKKTNGGLVNLSYFQTYWVGLDGHIYYQAGDDEKSPEYNSDTGKYIYYGNPIKKLTVDSEFNVHNDIYGYIPSEEYETYLSNLDSYKIEMDNRIYIISSSGMICEVYNQSGTPRKVSLSGLEIKTVLDVVSSEHYYYIAGSDKNNNTFLVKINPVDDSYIHLLPLNDYDVYACTASESDGVIFNALRMSDGKKVIGKVGINGGQVTMIDEESDVQITYLERIN